MYLKGIYIIYNIWPISLHLNQLYVFNTNILRQFKKKDCFYKYMDNIFEFN